MSTTLILDDSGVDDSEEEGDDGFKEISDPSACVGKSADFPSLRLPPIQMLSLPATFLSSLISTLTRRLAGLDVV
jgi:hypothetical protein